MDWDRPGHAFFDSDAPEREPVHVGVTLDLTALHIKALALARLPRRRHPAITVSRHLFLIRKLVSLY